MISPPSPENIDRASQTIREGGLVAFPTETVYGLGACAFSEVAVGKIFSLKRRPRFDPLIVHLADPGQIESVASIDTDLQRSRLKKLSSFWPGPLSVVLPKNPKLPDIVTAGLKSVAVRFPSHPVAQDFLRNCSLPIAAPSANPFGYISPTRASHVEKHFGDKIEMILDGGECPIGVESTIVSLLDETPVLLRHGAITLEMLCDTLGEVSVRTAADVAGSPAAPGMLKEHYAPRTPIVFREEVDISTLPEKTGIITFRADAAGGKDQAWFSTRVLSARGDFEEIARGLFAALHEFDEQGLELIVIDSCEHRDLGRAIMDRLTRATARS